MLHPRSFPDPTIPPKLAASLRVTDARLLWHLERLEAARQVSPTAGRWTRTASGDEAATRNPAGSRQVLPQDAVHDYEQAIAETQDGLHGDDFVQCGGEHGSRMSREQAEEFGDRLQSLVAEYFAPGRNDAELETCWQLHRSRFRGQQSRRRVACAGGAGFDILKAIEEWPPNSSATTIGT